MKNRINKLLKFAPIRVTYGILAAIVLKLPRIAFFVLSFFAIFWVGQQLYFKYAPSEQFLDFYYAKVDDTPIGTEPLMTLCRRINYDGIRIEAYRTFIQFQGDDEKPVTVGEYNFEANVERGDSNCTNVRLEKQPQRVGKYEAFTEYVFYVNGNRKAGSFRTNQYQMTAITLSADEQIKSLQKQIELLEAQLDELKRQNDSSTQSPSRSSTGSSSVEPQPTITRTSPQTTTPQPPQRDNTPETPPAPTPTPTAPPAPCIIPILGGGLLCSSDGLLRL